MGLGRGLLVLAKDEILAIWKEVQNCWKSRSICGSTMSWFELGVGLFPAVSVEAEINEGAVLLIGGVSDWNSTDLAEGEGSVVIPPRLGGGSSLLPLFFLFDSLDFSFFGG